MILTMRQDLTPQSIFTGLLAAFVGFAASFAVVLQGLRGVGANDEQAASGLMIAAVSMGLCSIVLSLKTRMPVGVAWSTPGAALLATAGAQNTNFSVAVGAFMVCGLLLVLAGIFRPLAKLIESIPKPLANALLAGVLLSLCLAPMKAIAFDPMLGIPIIAAWIVVGWFNKMLAVPAALLAFIAVVILGVEFPSNWQGLLSDSLIPNVVFTKPSLTIEAIFGIAIPLFVVTMASQNIPGLAVLNANDYHTPAAPLIKTTGLFSIAGATLGAHAVNLSAIVAAMMASEEGGKDRNKRYVAATFFGIGSVVLGVFAGVTTTFVSLAPTVLIEAVAGLALITAFTASSVAAFQEEASRPAAAVTFFLGTTVRGVNSWDSIASRSDGLISDPILKRKTPRDKRTNIGLSVKNIRLLKNI